MLSLIESVTLSSVLVVQVIREEFLRSLTLGQCLKHIV
jgi:hypothetical protein